LLVISLGSRT